MRSIERGGGGCGSGWALSCSKAYMVRDGEEPGARFATKLTERSFYRYDLSDRRYLVGSKWRSLIVQRNASCWSECRREEERSDMRPRKIHTSLLKHRLRAVVAEGGGGRGVGIVFVRG